MWDLVLWPGMEPGPLHWECGVLATDHHRSPKNKHFFFFYQFALLWVMLLVSYLRNLWFNTKSQKFLLLFSFRHCAVLGFTLMSVIHVELIFVYGMRYASKFFFFFCIWVSNCSSTICWKSCLFSWIAFVSLSKLGVHVYMGLFLYPVFYPRICLSMSVSRGIVMSGPHVFVIHPLKC